MTALFLANPHPKLQMTALFWTWSIKLESRRFIPARKLHSIHDQLGISEHTSFNCNVLAESPDDRVIISGFSQHTAVGRSGLAEPAVDHGCYVTFLLAVNRRDSNPHPVKLNVGHLDNSTIDSLAMAVVNTRH